jgi:DNA polymerase-3 subunit epsilon
MNPGHAIPSFITGFTGITNEMLRGQPSPQEVMPHLRSLLGDAVMVAHNAAFDQRFFEAEMALAGQAHQRTWLCSMRVARRLVPESRRHSLGALVEQFGIACPDGMQAHRALADALMTHELWQHLGRRARERLDGRHPSLEVLQALMSKPRKKVDAYFASLLADC